MHIMRDYAVYILRCADGSYYTGMTNDVDRRMHEHTVGLNRTCYTYERRPVCLVYSAHFHDVWDAIAWEKQVKRWSRKKKEALIHGDFDALHTFAACDNASHARYRHRERAVNHLRVFTRCRLIAMVRLRSP